MVTQGIKNSSANLSHINIKKSGTQYWNLSPEELIEHSIKKDEGKLTSLGAIVIKTGKYTGRSPQDRYIVKDSITEYSVDWNAINQPIGEAQFNQLHEKIASYLSDKELYVRDAYACADDDYRLNLRITSELPWSSQFAYNMFLRPTHEELKSFAPEWNIIQAPGFLADPQIDGTRQGNFAILNFAKKIILIGGTGYTGEIKKGIFSVLNYILPHQKNVLSMHCSANTHPEKGTAIFFGLSGTGKTTLSADPERPLIGDDEHGWSENGVFNFEGGCYAKTIDISKKMEPQIYNAIKHGAILENVPFKNNTRTSDFKDASITQNTRVSYPIDFIDNALPGSKSGHPRNIFFLTCDAFGVLPPISRLTPGQSMYHFISGYTAKVAGTEAGVTEPKTTFSACFGSPFLPLHPTRYAEMLGERMKKHNTNVWLVNTGWTGGAYGLGNRIKLTYTRAMITAVLNDQLGDVEYRTHEIFGLHMPTEVPGVPSALLNPQNTWSNSSEYEEKANLLAESFIENFKKFEDKANDEILAAAPKVKVV